MLHFEQFYSRWYQKYHNLCVNVDNVAYRKEVLAVIPKTAHNIADMKTDKWVHMVHSKLREIDNMNPQRSKVLFLG